MALFYVFVLACSGLIQYGVAVPMKRTYNLDFQYSRFSPKTGIPYCIDTTSYSAEEQAAFTTAFSIFANSPLGSCISFTPVACSSTSYHIKFTPVVGAAGSASQPYSFALPGNYTSANSGKGLTEQITSIVKRGDTYGTNCAATPRCILKYISILLGLRNEHQRGDRDGYITMNNPNVAVPAAFTFYTASQAGWTGSSATPAGYYDYCSITHNQPQEFARSGAAFSVPSGPTPGSIPQLQTLSYQDCINLYALYTCSGTGPAAANTVTDAQAKCTKDVCYNYYAAKGVVGTTQNPAFTTTLNPAFTTTLNPALTTTLNPALTTTTLSTTSGTSTSTSTSTTTKTTTTTTPACPVNFCSPTLVTLDEVGMLANGRMYMFSGTCAIEIDVNNRIIGSSVPISSLFPMLAPSGTTATASITTLTGGTVWSNPTTGITNVISGTQQYLCVASGCVATVPATSPVKKMFEYVPPSPAAVGAYSMDAPSATANFQNTNAPATNIPENTVQCKVGASIAACSGASPAMLITGGWSFAYGVSNFGSGAVNVIGPSTTAPSKFAIQQMKQETAGMDSSWAFDPANSIDLLSAFKCPPGSG